jgi:dimethylglycine dehydrogenase
MKQQARVVVIGGGAIGTSVLYHLAKYGWSDVVLLEKHELTSGSTWMAAGNCSFFHSNYYCTQVNQKSIEIYQRLEEETGQAVGWHTTGSIRTADNPGRLEELGYIYSMNRCLGLNVEKITPEKMVQLHPLINVEGLLGGLYWPDDGDVDPNGITQAMALGAKKLGAQIQLHTQVTGLTPRANGEWTVHTDQGEIDCEYVVNAAGLWGPEVAAMAGVEVPSIAGEHTHILFESIEAVSQRSAPLPLVRDPDRSIYVRQEMDSLILGLYEDKVKQWYPKGVPWSYAQAEIEPDIDHIAEFIEHGLYRFPIMSETGFKHVTAGPITYTPNGDPLVGPAYGLRNFFHACGYSFGITQAGGIGHYLAGWIMEGEPEIDLWPMDSRRYGSYANWAYQHQKIEDTYPRLYSIIYPNEWRDAARPNRTSPIYEEQKKAGAVFGDYYGWECPNYFTQNDEDRYEKPTWKRSNAFPYVADECRHAAEKVALLDLTRFAKMRVSGPEAADWLNRLSCQRVPRKVGRSALAPMLDHRGAFKSDMTITKTGPEEFFCVTASVGKRHDHHWMELNQPTGQAVQLHDATYEQGCFVVVGPSSRALLAQVSDADVSAQAFPFGTSQPMTLGRTPCLVNRMNYVGELGYEIFHPIEQQHSLYQTLCEAGQAFELRLIGMLAMESMRLEKGYLAWKSEMNVHHSPLETPVDWTVKWKKDFIGKEALVQQRESGVDQRLVCLVVEAGDADALGYNPILAGEERIGMTSSGGYGHRTQRSLALGYVPPRYAEPGTKLAVEVLGQPRPAEVVTIPVYDPDHRRMKG